MSNMKGDKCMLKRTFFLSFTFVMFSSFVTTAAIDPSDEIEVQIIPYLKVLEQLSREVGVNHFVPEKNKEKFYESVKGMTTKEFAIMMREQYKSSEQFRDSQTNYSGENARIGNAWPDKLPNYNGKIKIIQLE